MFEINVNWLGLRASEGDCDYAQMHWATVRMRRRDFMKSAALASASGVIGLGIFSQFSRRAVATGNNRLGAWSSGLGQSMAEWPLIPSTRRCSVTAGLLTYGTNSNGQQTGYFIYDGALAPSVGRNIPRIARLCRGCSRRSQSVRQDRQSRATLNLPESVARRRTLERFAAEELAPP